MQSGVVELVKRTCLSDVICQGSWIHADLLGPDSVFCQQHLVPLRALMQLSFAFELSGSSLATPFISSVGHCVLLVTLGTP